MMKSLLVKKWGTKSLNKDSFAFQSFVDSMKLVDMVSSNGLFTWNNKRGGESLVASELDRFIITEDLMLNNKEMAESILPFGGSDHWLVQLEVKGIGTPRNRPFRLENIWLSHPDFINKISGWWSEYLHIQGTSMFLLHKRLKHIKCKLKDWNKKEFGDIFEGKKAVENKLQELNQVLISTGFNKVRDEKANKLQQEWENFCKQEEIFWRQKSRVQWLKEGEQNTRFFHRSTLTNRAHNRISSIKDEEGHLLSFHEGIEVMLVQHFCGIARETISDREHFIKDLTRHIPRLVSREDNLNLNRPVTEEEVSEVLKQMKNGKAPGPDGFNVDFFKACWNIVKQDILNVVEDSKKDKTILKALNTTFISLIPKQELAQTPDRFRPISLCNVVYKIISKVVANRLKPLLPTLVSVEQSGYVEGRQILNNIIQAHEVVHSLTINRKAGMIMQLDIAKYYDKLNWTYIKKILSAFGFDHNWIKWVMALVTSSSFSILVNGSPSETFIPSRSLTKGYPLSPFLFILMMEGLGRSIKHAKAVGKVIRLQLSENGQALTHQQFVDDTMLQGITTDKEALAYKEVLSDFAMASGLSKVKDFWDQTNSLGKWRTWRNFNFMDDSPLKAKAETLIKILDQRNILLSEGKDQLRWGNNNERTFSLKEAKLILLNLISEASDRIWKDLWKRQGWIKIKLFMWLVQNRKILTWDNIRKRGVLGPSRCQLCEAQEETMEHLLNNCISTSRLWDSFATIFQQTDRDKGSIINTLNKWRRNFSDYEVLGSAWAITPGFIIWNVWKERKNRIFKNERRPSQCLSEQILKQLKETVGTIVCNLPKDPPSVAELRMLSELGLQGLIPQRLDRRVIPMES
eukprot:PITA_34910